MFATYFSSFRTAVLLGTGAALALTLTGCSGLAGTASSPQTAGTGFIGSVHGGQQPVTGSHIYLYAVGAGGYGSASSSLITTGTAGVTTDANGNGYVLTDANGNFNFTAFTCPTSSTETYLLALGGNPGLSGTVNNTAIAMLSPVGMCGNITPSTTININELSTVAMTTTMQQFIVDSTHIGSTSTNVAGLVNAETRAFDLINPNGSARSTNLAGTGTVPAAKLNSLADILAPCVNTSSAASSLCTSLFNATKPAGGSAPTTVAGAMLLIASNPGYNVDALYNMQNAAAPFQPQITPEPNDFTVGITVTGGGLVAPADLVIDANGAVWAANCPTCGGPSGGVNGGVNTTTDTIVGFSANGAVLSGAAGYTAGIHKPQQLAFDAAGNLWSANLASGSVTDAITKQTSAGALIFSFHDSTINGPEGLAIDNANAAWVANQTGNSVVKVNTDGTRTVSPVFNSTFTFPNGIGLDAQGFVYTAGAGSNSILRSDGNGNTTAIFTGNGLSQPISITIDNSDRVYSINNQSSGISIFNGANGSVAAGSPAFNNLSNANILAVDGFDHFWYANCRISCGGTKPDDLNYTSNTGVSLPASDGYQDPNFKTVTVAAIDFSGDVWVSNGSGGSLTEILGVAGPVRTPLVSATFNGQLGSRP